MALDRFGHGTEMGDKNLIDFEKALMKVGIDPNVSQEELWKIYQSAKENNNKEIVSTLDKWFDSWN
tara:strand:+ start:1165 stop:1362 length:198 start_codon:yes stop_codon:yes gene_type:complete